MSLKLLVSKIFGITISDGYGLTTDDSVKLKEIPKQATEGKPLGKFSALYVADSESGVFELLGHRRTTSGKSSITLRHSLTGETFSIPYNLFTLLFKKKPTE